MAWAPSNRTCWPSRERLVRELDGVGDERLEARDHAEVRLGDLAPVEGQAVVDLGQHGVLLAHGQLELLREDPRVEQVLHPDADARGLVGVGRADAPLGGAELVLAEEALDGPVELLVVRHDQVGVAREPHPTGVDPARLEHVELGEEDGRVDDHAVADDGGDARVEDPARHELQLQHLLAVDDRVPGVVPALVAHDHVGRLGQVVDEAALALVTPLGADDHRAGHARPPAGARSGARLSGTART